MRLFLCRLWWVCVWCIVSAGAPNAKVALLRWQNIKNIKVKKRTCLCHIAERAVKGNRPMHRRKKSVAMYRKKSEAI